MGQMTYGLCYGVREPRIAELDAWLDDYATEAMRGVRGDYWEKRWRIVPRWTADGTDFLGFFIAAGASGMDGIPRLEGCHVSAIEADKRYKKSLKAAANAWAKFDAWCEKRGISLPDPQLWLIECEVA